MLNLNYKETYGTKTIFYPLQVLILEENNY